MKFKLRHFYKARQKALDAGNIELAHLFHKATLGIEPAIELAEKELTIRLHPGNNYHLVKW